MKEQGTKEIIIFFLHFCQRDLSPSLLLFSDANSLTTHSQHTNPTWHPLLQSLQIPFQTKY